MTDFIFQHGGMVGGYIWDELAEAMDERQPGNRYLKLDIPGCGAKRGLDPYDYSFDSAIDTLLADIDASGRRPPLGIKDYFTAIVDGGRSEVVEDIVLGAARDELRGEQRADRRVFVAPSDPHQC